MMVRKMAVHLEEQLGGVDVDLLENAMDHRARGAVARVGHHLDAAIEMKLRRDFVHVRRDGVGGGQGSDAGFEIRALDDVEHFLDRFAMQRARAANAFEAVVLGWIVAAGDHDGAVGIQVLRRVVEHGRGHGADVGDVASGGPQTFDQRIAQARGAEAAIAPDIDVRAAALTAQIRAQAAAKLLDVRAQQFGIRDAPDVVFAENGRLEHISRFYRLRTMLAAHEAVPCDHKAQRPIGAVRDADARSDFDFEGRFIERSGGLVAGRRLNPRHSACA